MVKMCDVLDYHMEDGEKHFNLTSTLYYFLTKALLIFEKKYLIISVFSIYQICLFYKENIKKNG